MKRILIILTLLFSQTILADATPKDVEVMFRTYVTMLKEGNLNEAMNHWALLDRTNTDQLKIQFRNTPIKLEAGSKLMEYLEPLKSGKATLTVDSVSNNRGFAKILYHITLKDTTIIATHYAITSLKEQPELTTPLRVFTESWDGAQGRYIDLVYRDESLFERSNIEMADQFIDDVANQLGISNEKMVILESIKFKDVLCESFGEVQEITGKIGLGEYLRPIDAVVSKYFPAYNEIARFLVNYANDTLPICTLPFMENGTATFLGGRWGRSASVLLSVGSYIYTNKFVDLDKLVTVADFNSFEGNPDFSYPVAGLFCKYLFKHLGREKFFTLYRELSGTSAEVNSITTQKFEDLVASAYGATWVAVEKDFREFAKTQSYAGILAGSDNKGNLVYESGLPSLLVRVLEDSNYYNFTVKISAGEPHAALLVGLGSDNDRFSSFLFREYFPDTTYEHQRYAIIFSPSEVGTYDFFSNVITGKYIAGFTGEQAVSKSDPPEYQFKIEKNLIPGFDKKNARLLLLK